MLGEFLCLSSNAVPRMLQKSGTYCFPEQKVLMSFYSYPSESTELMEKRLPKKYYFNGGEYHDVQRHI